MGTFGGPVDGWPAPAMVISRGPGASGRVGKGLGRGVEGLRRAVEKGAFGKDQICVFFHFRLACFFAEYVGQNACPKPNDSPSGCRTALLVFPRKNGKPLRELCAFS